MIWILFILGLALTGIALISIYVGISAKSWPSVTGKVLASEVQVRVNPHSSSKSEFFHPIIAYEYSIAGRTYRSRRLGAFLAFGSDRRFTENITARFSVNSQPRVYHHPLFPGISVLMPGIQQPMIHLVLFLTGVLVLVASGLMLFSDNPTPLIDWMFRFIDNGT